MEQIREAMDANDGCLRHPLSVPRMRGQLRLVIRCRRSLPASWSMAVILYSGRVDGRIACIDWEGSFVTIDGERGSGFHRHIWDPGKMDCENSKMPLPAFQPSTVEEFISQGFALLGVKNAEDSSNEGTQLSIH